MTDADLAHPRQDAHFNFEMFSKPTGQGVRQKAVSNIHIFLPQDLGGTNERGERDAFYTCSAN